MKTTKLEKLNEGELIFGSPTAGKWLVREYEDDIEMGGSFFNSEEEAKAHIETLKEK
tara:strand:- start:36 stop:206 length:171 start_codon:yes stop_codon:yes gene_type:complete